MQFPMSARKEEIYDLCSKNLQTNERKMQNVCNLP